MHNQLIERTVNYVKSSRMNKNQKQEVIKSPDNNTSSNAADIKKSQQQMELEYQQLLQQKEKQIQEQYEVY
jgi:hypothetical protein